MSNHVARGLASIVVANLVGMGVLYGAIWGIGRIVQAARKEKQP